MVITINKMIMKIQKLQMISIKEETKDRKLINNEVYFYFK
jgi:hypothetical protein